MNAEEEEEYIRQKNIECEESNQTEPLPGEIFFEKKAVCS